MPTSSPQWMNTGKTLPTVILKSDPQVAKDVNATALDWHRTNPTKFPHHKQVSIVTGLPARQHVGMDPGSLLRELSRLTTPPQLRGKDFYAASQWAWVRYRWAFARDNANSLVLAEDAMLLPHHHAAVFSEHVGVAFGLEAARRALRSAHPNHAITFHDVDFILNGTDLDGHLFGTWTKRRPDYIARVASTTTVSYYAVECKGRRANVNSAIVVQLATAAFQVNSLLINGQPLPSLMASTAAGPHGIQVQLLDPPGDLPTAPLPPRVEPAYAPGAEWQAPANFDLEEFAARVEAVAVGEILLDAGRYREASVVLVDNYAEANARSRTVEVDGRSFVGQMIEIDVRGQQLSYFQGVDINAVESALISEPISAPGYGRSETVVSDRSDALDGVDPGLPLSGWGMSDPDDAGYVIGCWPTDDLGA